MISITHFKQLIKSNFKIFILFTLLLNILISIIMVIFDPEMIETINSSSTELPFNPLGDISSLIRFISGQYFGMMAFILTLLYLVFVANRLIASRVENGDMLYTLATPTTRKQITTTSAVFLIVSLMLMYVSLTITGIIVAQIVQPGELDITTFILLSFGAFLLQFTLSGIAFCSSCIHNRTNKSLLFGAGIPVFFFIINMLIQLSDSLDPLKAFSLFELYNKDAIINGDSVVLSLLGLGIIGLSCYIAGIVYFNKKDLPL